MDKPQTSEMSVQQPKQHPAQSAKPLTYSYENHVKKQQEVRQAVVNPLADKSAEPDKPHEESHQSHKL